MTNSCLLVVEVKPLHLKQKALKKSAPLKTAAKLLWPWFSFIFADKKKYLLLFSALAFLLINGFLQFPSTSKAASIDSQSVQVEESVDNNNVKTYNGGSVVVNVTLKLLSPGQIVAGSGTSGNDRLTSGAFVDNPINGVAIGAVNKIQNDTACVTNTSFLGQSFFKCKFSYISSDWPSVIYAFFVNSTWKQNTNLNFKISLSQSDLSNLGVQYSDAGTINEIYLYPYFEILGINTNTTFSAAKSVYITAFNTALQASSTPISGGIPQNGSTTSTPQQSPGGGLTSLLNQIVAFILSLFQQLIYEVFAWLVLPIILAVLSIHPYQDTFVAVIYSGWETVRNLCDIFFIVALIIIAMATLFRVESYKARHLLVQLIIAALLINFSLVIGQAILALADTVQAQFLPSNGAAVQNLGKQLMTTNNSAIMAFLKSQQVNANASAVNSSFGGFIASIFWLAMSLGSFAVFCAIAVFLVIRIVALWLLLMISPVAYAAGVLPSTSHYREEWWKNFLKYAFFTPIMAFFLNMTAIMATNATVNKQLQITAQNASIFGQQGFANLVVTLGSNILLIVFLIASLKVATQAGIYGAEGITGAAKKYGVFGTFAVAGGGAKFVGGAAGSAALRKKTALTTKWFGDAKPDKDGKYGFKGRSKQTLFAMFNPGGVKQALEDRRKKKTEDIGKQASLTAEEVVRSLPFIREPALALADEGFVHAYEHDGKELTPYQSERQAYGVVKLFLEKMKKNPGDLSTRQGYFGAVDQLIQGKGFNYMLEQQHKEVSTKGALQWVNEQVEKGFMTKGQAGQTMAALSKHAYDNNEYWYAEAYQLDHHGHPQIINTDKNGEVIGEAEFQTQTAALDSQFETYVSAKNASTGMDKETIRKRDRNTFKDNFEEKLEHSDHKAYEKYKNYAAYEGSNKEAYTNYTKKGARARVADGHWSMVADISKEGKYNISNFTVRHMLDADKSDYAQSTHMNKKKKRALQRMVYDEGGGGSPAHKAVAKTKIVNKMIEEDVNREVQNMREEGKEVSTATIATITTDFNTRRSQYETRYQNYYDEIIADSGRAASPAPIPTTGTTP